MRPRLKAGHLLRKFGRELEPMQPGDVPQTFADISKARRLLNYNPQTPIESGIKKFVQWFQSKRAS